jgi:glycosyltransferase involved in cell wall biosynthesis
MTVQNFFNVDNEKEYKYQILVYPNITFQSDLEKDSYVVVLRNIIMELNKIRDDMFFTIISPKIIRSLEFPNTRQVIIQFPSYPNQMRLHFDSINLLKELEWKGKSYDIVFSHLPEHTLQLKNLFYNTTNERPIFIGYTHWTEFKEITSYTETVIDINILGLLSMVKCGINTQGQKDMVLAYAKTKFIDAEKLNDILQPLYLGAETPVIDTSFTLPSELMNKKIIVFNHRAHAYKNYDWFLKQMDELYKTRKDFVVWVPLAESIDRPYISNIKFSRPQYFACLEQSYVGICCEQKYAGWSVSATDGMSVGLPYMFSHHPYYFELVGNAGIHYYSKEDFVEKLNILLDDREKRYEWSDKALERFEDLKWNKQIIPINEMFEKAISLFPVLRSETTAYKGIANYIREKGKITKKDLMKHLGWGVNIPFTAYRNKLRFEKDIIFTRDGYKVR